MNRRTLIDADGVAGSFIYLRLCLLFRILRLREDRKAYYESSKKRVDPKQHDGRENSEILCLVDYEDLIVCRDAFFVFGLFQKLGLGLVFGFRGEECMGVN